MLQVSVASSKPIGADQSADAVILADIQIRSLAAGDIDMDKINQNQQNNKLSSVETEKSDPVALSPDDLNSVNAAKVQSWQIIQSAKELAEARAQAEKEQAQKNNQ
ncbi:hypothetical protein FO519_006490 [Halicephalobus sp. NKZ332]|nr:hypothetical protein FO519_006490 [Halicephalobus sp. NKZ332]